MQLQDFLDNLIPLLSDNGQSIFNAHYDNINSVKTLLGLRDRLDEKDKDIIQEEIFKILNP
jgi:hypothetical protein